MPPRLATLYPAPRAGKAPPPIFTTRTLGLPTASAIGATLCWALGWGGPGWALAGVSAVTFMQLLAPAIRQRSLSRAGWVSELLFALPFVLFFMPYFVWCLLFPPSFQSNAIGIVAAATIALGVRLTELSKLRLSFDREMLALMPPLRRSTLFLRSYQTMAAAVGQEIFYRGSLFVLLTPIWGWGVVAISTVFFVAEHWSNRWATMFTRAYMIRIAMLATGLGIVVYVTGSVVAAVVGHVVYNLVPVVQGIRHRGVNPYRSARS